MNSLRRSPWIRPLLTLAGAALVFGGERLAAATPARIWLSIAGAVVLFAGFAWCIAYARSRGDAGDSRQRAARLWVLVPQLAFLIAGLAYALALWIGNAPANATWAGVLRFTWALATPMGAVVWAFVEIALWRQEGVGEVDGSDRLRRAAASGVWLALLLGLVIVVNFAGTRLSWQWDVSYFKTTDPSDATRKAAGGLNDNVQIALFFPANNPVAQELDGYFRQLIRSTPKLTYGMWDADLDPDKAKEFQARGNGWMVLKRGEQLRPTSIPMKLDDARNTLKRFDSDLLTGLMEISREPRVVYTTVGHGERFETNRANAAPDNSDRFSAFETFLRTRNLKVQQLDYAKGLGSAIPADASLVIIAGPTEPFFRADADAVGRYLKAGGRLMVFLEPGDFTHGPAGKRQSRSSDPLLAVLKEYGVQFDSTPRANDRIFGRRTYTDADHALLVTIAFEAHPSTAPLRAAPNQFPLAFLGAGALHLEQAPTGLKVQALVNGMPGTFADTNNNFRFDAASDKQEIPTLVAALSPANAPSPQPNPAQGQVAGPYMLVYADADVASDLLVGNRANGILISSGVEWLLGQEPAGIANVEEDQRIQHMRSDEWLWFYLPVVAVPLLVLGGGLWRLRRRNKRHDAARRAA